MKRLTHHKYPPLLIWPCLIWFFVFMLAPLLYVLVFSFAHKGAYGGVLWKFSFENYLRSFNPIYLRVLLESIKLAVITALSCLCLGYPLAYVLVTSQRKIKNILLTLVVVPFWTNFVVRAYSIKLLLGVNGPINEIGIWLGLWQEPILLSDSAVSVWLGMMSNYLPFMILPLYVALDEFDFSLLEAARDLGASTMDLLIKILFPLTAKGMFTGFVFVFTPALGEFVIPDLLGGARTMLMGNLVTDQFLKTRDWPFGSALSILLMLSVTLSLIFYLRLNWKEEKQ